MYYYTLYIHIFEQIISRRNGAPRTVIPQKKQSKCDENNLHVQVYEIVYDCNLYGLGSGFLVGPACGKLYFQIQSGAGSLRSGWDEVGVGSWWCQVLEQGV